MTLSDIRLFEDWGFGLRALTSFFLLVMLTDMATDLMALLHVAKTPEAEPIAAPFGMSIEAHRAFIVTFLMLASLSVKFTMESLLSPQGVPLFKPGSTTPLAEYPGLVRSFGELRLEVKAYLVGLPMTAIVPMVVQALTF